MVVLLASNCGYAAPKIGAKGTTQMAGDWGIMNRPYSLGDKGSKMNFTLKSAEYTVGQVVVGTETYIPKEGEKLLVIRYTVHNPEKVVGTANWATFKFTAVDAEEANHPNMLKIGQEPSLKDLSSRLKPAQKVEAYAVIKVGAKGEVPKLIVQRGSGLVLRYDLTGKVKPLAAEYADPSDPTGATLISEVAGSIGQYYHAGDYDFKVNSIEVRSESSGKKIQKGKALVVIGCTVKNKAAIETTFTWTAVKPSLIMDSSTAKWDQGLVDLTSLEDISPPKLAPGQETTLGFVFVVKADTKPVTLLCKNKAEVTVKFDVPASE